MSHSSPWPTIHSERAVLAADLSVLPESAWSTRSSCDGWTVQQVLAHMASTAAMTPVRFVAKMASAGFRFRVMTAREVDAYAAGSPQDTLARFRDHLDATTAPPGPVDTWLGETIVHGTDIRWPLALEREFPTDALIRVADFYRRSNVLIGAKKRISGLSLNATDADWSAGEGPSVSGPLLALVMAMTGRRAALERISGPGVDVLRSRAQG